MSFKDFFRFILKPNGKDVVLTLQQIIAIIIFTFILFFFTDLLVIKLLINTDLICLPRRQGIMPDSPIFKAISALLIAPVIEELTYRLPLKFSVNYIAVSFSLFLFYIVRILFSGFEYNILCGFVLAFLAFFISRYFLYQRKVKLCLYIFWKKHFPIIFYSLAFIFAFNHIFNF